MLELSEAHRAFFCFGLGRVAGHAGDPFEHITYVNLIKDIFSFKSSAVEYSGPFFMQVLRTCI